MILVVFLNLILENKDLDLEALVDDFLSFFLAGQETTANTLAFCLLELGRNKDILDKMRQEIDIVLGDRTEITYQDTIDLKYCTGVFRETLRLYPPIPIIFRSNSDEMTVNELKIPANSIFFVSSFSIHYF